MQSKLRKIWNVHKRKSELKILEDNEMLDWAELAEQGNAAAQYRMGAFYELRQELDPAGKRARTYYEAAARQGHAGAQLALGSSLVKNQNKKNAVNEGIFWLSCAYLHGGAALEEGIQAKHILDDLIVSGLKDGRARVYRTIDEVDRAFSEYTQNPAANEAF